MKEFFNKEPVNVSTLAGSKNKNFRFNDVDELTFNMIKLDMQKKMNELNLNNKVKSIDVIRSLMATYVRDNNL